MATLRVRDAARLLNVSEKTVYKWLRQGSLPANRVGSTWIIAEESVKALLAPSATTSASPGRTFRSGTARSLGSIGSHSRPESSEPTHTQDSLRQALAELQAITAGAIENGISGVLGPRRLDQRTPRAIATALESAEGEVLLQGVGLREFFGDRDHAVILRKMAAEDRPASVRAILVDPTGQFARARTVVQDGEQFADDALFRAGPLFSDSWRSLNAIAALKKASRESANFRLDVRFVDHWPSTYLVLTGESAFVETYHFGRSSDAVEGDTIDGLVPMLRVMADSSYYELLRDHFDYLWSGKNPFLPAKTMEQIAESVQVQL